MYNPEKSPSLWCVCVWGCVCARPFTCVCLCAAHYQQPHWAFGLTVLAENSPGWRLNALLSALRGWLVLCRFLIFFFGPKLIRTSTTSFYHHQIVAFFSIFSLSLYKLPKPQSTFWGIIEGWHFRKASVQWFHSPWDFPTCCILNF